MDDHGDDFENATELVSGETVDGVLETPSDWDVFSFEVLGNETQYEILFSAPPGFEEAVDIRDASGRFLDSIVDYDAIWNSDGSVLLVFNTPIVGDYYVAVNDPLGVNSDVEYSITYNEVFNPAGNAGTSGYLVRDGRTTSGSLSISDEADWYALTIDAPQLLNFNLNHRREVDVNIYAEDGSLVASLTDENTGDFNIFEAAFSFEAGGKYFVEVLNSFFNPYFEYDISVSIAEPTGLNELAPAYTAFDSVNVIPESSRTTVETAAGGDGSLATVWRLDDGSTFSRADNLYIELATASGEQVVAEVTHSFEFIGGENVEATEDGFVVFYRGFNTDITLDATVAFETFNAAGQSTGSGVMATASVGLNGFVTLEDTIVNADGTFTAAFDVFEDTGESTQHIVTTNAEGELIGEISFDGLGAIDLIAYENGTTGVVIEIFDPATGGTDTHIFTQASPTASLGTPVTMPLRTASVDTANGFIALTGANGAYQLHTFDAVTGVLETLTSFVSPDQLFAPDMIQMADGSLIFAGLSGGGFTIMRYSAEGTLIGQEDVAVTMPGQSLTSISNAHLTRLTDTDFVFSYTLRTDTNGLDIIQQRFVVEELSDNPALSLFDYTLGIGDDAFDASEGNDAVNGLEGDDTINGLGGNDQIDGGAGADTLDGGAGNDVILGGDQNDILYGGDGDDQVLGQRGADFLYGGAGNDLVLGGNRNDRLFGEDGNDRVFGGNDQDVIDGGAGIDIGRGGNGDDVLNGGDDGDVLFGGTGRDTVSGDGGR